MQNRHLFIVTSIVIFAVLLRFLPHMPNMAPITALAIFAAAYLPLRYAFGLIIVIRLISDYYLGFFELPLMLAVYLSHFAGIFVGYKIKQGAFKNKYAKVFLGSIGTAVLFYLLTNLVILYPDIYPQTVQGQITSYINAAPFIRGTLLGDVMYSLMFFGVYDLAVYLKKVQLRKRLTYRNS